MTGKNHTKTTLLLISTLTVMSGATIAPSLPQMAIVFKDVPNAEFLSKLLLTLPALSIAVIAPFSGILVDKLGRLSILNPALLLYAISGAVGYFVHDLVVILIGRFLLGVSVGCIMTVAITLIGDYYSGEERTRLIGYQAAFMSLGGAIFVSLGGFLADLHWSYPFLIYLFSLVTLIMGRFTLSEPKKTKISVAKESNRDGLGQIYTILIVACVSMIVFYILPVQLPFFLWEIGLEKNSQTGLAIAIATLVAALLGILYNSIRKLISLQVTYVLLFLLMGIGFYLTANSTNFYDIALSMVVLGIGMGLLMPNLNNHLLAKTNDSNRGKFSGFLSATLFLGQFLSPIVVAPINQSFGTLHAYLFGSAILMLLSLIYFVGAQSHRIQK